MSDYIPKAPMDDEARKHNERLSGMGGVFNYVNFHVYHYAGNNPVKYTDPDGRDDDIPKVDLSKISDETKVQMLNNVLGNLSYKLVDNYGDMVEAYNALNQGDVSKINNLVENYASESVNIRKQFFSMTGDSDRAVDSPDYQMYATSIKEITQGFNMVNGGVMGIGEIQVGIQKLLNPKSIGIYKIDKINSTYTLSSNIQEFFKIFRGR
jgi:GTPase